MRGKQPHHTSEYYRFGNIPAYAGKTFVRQSRPLARSEHPRVCGENMGFRVRESRPVGTSPRMRGKLPQQHAGRNPRRNIPAYAGKTQGSNTSGQAPKEHPRVCGENMVASPGRQRGTGTSPRMRGKHLLTCGSSFLKVILHSILFFCTVGGSMESPLQLPPF